MKKWINDVSIRQSKQYDDTNTEAIDWKLLKRILLQNLRDRNYHTQFSKLSDKFYEDSSKIIGTDREFQYISLLTAHFFKAFLLEKHLSSSLKTALISKYGISLHESFLLDDLFSVTKEIEKMLDENIMEKIKRSNDYNFYDVLYEDRQLFGKDIKVSLTASNKEFKENSIDLLLKCFNKEMSINIPKEVQIVKNIDDKSNDDIPFRSSLESILSTIKSDFSLLDLVESVKKLLIGNASNDDLQNDLFDLLGIDGLDIIPDILTNRESIVKYMKDGFAIKKETFPKGNVPPSNHSDFTQHQMRTSNPFPFVFDKSYGVDRTKITMSNVESENCREFEKRKIPARDSCDPIPVERVKISSLDDIGQIGFEGMKQLNLIQSVVFETAYGTNENMLVCAPTGAGKTNIAMLTILHQIKQNIGAGGKVKLNEFKIIYVAPMKALAAEMTRTFSFRLKKLGIVVRECTGDMQLSKQEIVNTQMIVTTPEKYDVITRKSTGDTALVQLVKLLIIDEVHLLHEDRGSVIESIVARTLRQVESHQKVIRIVGLSATLPNYFDVAQFIGVNPFKGLFYFDSRFRPVPLNQTLIGVKPHPIKMPEERLNEECLKEVISFLEKDQQVMVFVHARTETQRTARFLCNSIKELGRISLIYNLQCTKDFEIALKRVERSKDQCLRDLFKDGFACHHAGMLRPDRSFVEDQFLKGNIRVLCCTATLAWGVNLPAHAVIIKGTQIYDAEKSSFVDLGILDVLQIFGRAGRPQFDKNGHGIIICKHEKLAHYQSLLLTQYPIESNLMKSLNDCLNAEIVLGTVTNVQEAVRWLQYTYLYVRMAKNPLNYGITREELRKDSSLFDFRYNLITESARQLDKARLVRFNENNGYLTSTDAGRLTSHYYIKYETASRLMEEFSGTVSREKVFQLLASSNEFAQMKVRNEELDELDEMKEQNCQIKLVHEDTTDIAGKVNILIQSYISRQFPRAFSLVSDLNFITQSIGRIARYLFERSLRNGWALMAGEMLEICKSIEHQLWKEQTPLRQFQSDIHVAVLERIERKKIDIEFIRTTPVKELQDMIGFGQTAHEIQKMVNYIPFVEVDVSVQPITRTILRLQSKISPKFKWNDRYHSGQILNFWIWVEDPDSDSIHYSEVFGISKKQVINKETIELVFAIPIFEPMPQFYILRVDSDRWIGSVSIASIPFQNLILPEIHPPHTNLLDLRPLPVTALKNDKFQSIYSFSHFNPIQTQIFHSLYHSDTNVLLGAPTGSGKTVAAELAIMRVFRIEPAKKCVYIAPLKALVRERFDEWKVKFESKLGKKIVELTGDIAPDMKAVASADVIITTPEKWDGVSRSWTERKFVQDVRLIVIDEIHLLGEDRGPVLEVIVSRNGFISAHTNSPVRIVGLSTALANARDLADWLHIDPSSNGLYNFRPSVRPVPLQVHIQGFPGRHYCPRMATMNKPLYQAIEIHSKIKPVLVFVSSRRQTRLTALDLISFLAASDDCHQWRRLISNNDEMQLIIDRIHDPNLKLTIAYGIGLHHAGLHESDRKLVEWLFLNQKIQILIATSTLAWGVNFPAHLVVVKGTEYFDGRTKRYVDYPITDVLQMMGRAGRPQFDDSGKALIMVHDTKKDFYKKFLYEPFPVESSLLKVLADHLNAEIVSGSVGGKQQAMTYLTYTFFFRRLLMNPNYYGLDAVDHCALNGYLSRLVEQVVSDLEQSHCVTVDGEGPGTLEADVMGRIASYYYLKHVSVRLFHDKLRLNTTLSELLDILSLTDEFAELPVRHNEDQLNADLSKKLPILVNPNTMDSPHTKAHLLLQAHFCRADLPIVDYHVDTKLVLDQAIRIVQAMIDTVGSEGWLPVSLRLVQLIQMIVQGLWIDDHPLRQLPGIEDHHIRHLANIAASLPELMDRVGNKYSALRMLLSHGFDKQDVDRVFAVVCSYPVMEVTVQVRGPLANNEASDDVLIPAKVMKIPAGDEENNDLVEDLFVCNVIVPPVPNGRLSSWACIPRLGYRLWIPLLVDREYFLQVQLHQRNFPKTGTIPKAFAPKFPKPKDEGYIVILGHPENQELVALRRIPMIRQEKTKVTLSFFSPEKPGRYIYRLYVMSDCYMSLDQEIPICFCVSGDS